MGNEKRSMFYKAYEVLMRWWTKPVSPIGGSRGLIIPPEVMKEMNLLPKLKDSLEWSEAKMWMLNKEALLKMIEEKNPELDRAFLLVSFRNQKIPNLEMESDNTSHEQSK